MSKANEGERLAGRLLASAYSFHWLAARIANGDWQDIAGHKFKPYPLLYTNLGYAVELSIKAYIAWHGVTEGEIKDKIGHDLKKALKRAHDLGMTQGNAATALINAIGPHHKKRHFVYLQDIDVEKLPDFQEALAASCELIRMIGALLPINDLIS